MKKFDSIYSGLLNYADNMVIIDTHEHLNPHKNYLGDEPDVLCDYFSHYISTDLQSCGMSRQELDKVYSHKIDIMERFMLLEPYLECVKNTSYYRSLEIAAKKIHDIDEISVRTIEELNLKYIKAVTREDYRKYIMKDLCNIEVSINDYWDDDMHKMTTGLFVPAWQPVVYLNYTAKDDDEPCSQEAKFKLEDVTFDEYCEYIKRHLTKQINDGAKTLKFPVAYWRSLYFEDVDYAVAKKLYDDVAKTKDEFPKELQDYIMHFVLNLSNECSFPVQIHTGLQEGMGHNLKDSNPMLLASIFDKYPNVAFDLFHTGYPYERELAVLAKTHANVYVDFCWSHLISPFAAKNAFYEMLDVLPYSKILGFGGDYLFYDGVVGHLMLTKQNICTVLAQKVLNSECSSDLAEKILQAVLYDNAKIVFKL
jgi:hypothetical protein